MSGGSMNYVFADVERAAEMLAPEQGDPSLWRAVHEHLELMAKALHDIEWVQSGDYGSGDETEAIEALFRHGFYVYQMIADGDFDGQ